MSGAVTAPGERLARVAGAARAALEARARELDDLNVFPVADGDTGANMLMTAVAVERAAAASAGEPRAERCAALARAALMGARGNSGMILSALVRGAAEALAGDAGPLDGPAVARALRAAADAAYAAVRRPVEGTMLTVARRMADAAEGAGAGAAEALDAALAGGRRAVDETPRQLAALAEAGVVDAGGLGLVALLEGAAAGLAGREPPAAPRAEAARPAAGVHPPSRHRYCTTFLLEGTAIDHAALEAAMEGLGDSLLVMGDAGQAKVHLHTDAPERAADLARAWGAVADLRVDDMRRQEAERDARLRRRAPAGACGALVLVPGAGARALAEGLGAAALDPGAGPEAVAAALVALGTPEAVLVTAGAGGPAPPAPPGLRVRCVDAGSPPAALACLVAHDPARGAEDNARAMADLAAGVAVAEVEGADPGELRRGLEAALGRLVDGPALVTVLVGAGAGVPAAEVEAWGRAAVGPGVEVEAHDGGQERPALAVGVE